MTVGSNIRKDGGVRLRVGRDYLRDLVTRPRPTTLDEVPPSAEAVTPEWLSLALSPDGRAKVVSVVHEPVSSGTSVRSRLRVEYDRAVAEIPPPIFVKSPPTFHTRMQVGVSGGAKAEIRFYRDIQPTIPVTAPRGYFG